MQQFHGQNSRIHNQAYPHRLALLFGGSSNATDTDTGKNNHTVHHNWFGNLVDQRMPCLLFGKGHIFNNYYNSPGNSYCIGSGSWSSLLVRNNYFKDVKSPHRFQDTNPSYVPPACIYDNTTGKSVRVQAVQENPPGAWTIRHTPINLMQPKMFPHLFNVVPDHSKPRI
ncbi:hypothetical protein P4S72_16910 [Vibrio sp. PP-XX7]